MRNAGSGRCCRKRCASGVGKQVQNLNRPAGAFYLFRDPVPVCRLFGEKPCMLKAERLQIKSERTVVNAPLFGKVKEFPLTTAAAAPVIVAVPDFPFGICLRCVPDDLRVGTNQQIRSSFSPSEVSMISYSFQCSAAHMLISFRFSGIIVAVSII